jgi:hypothetical protein
MRTQLTQGIAALAALSLAGGLIACDNRILRVTAPDQIPPTALSSASALPTVTAAVYGDFGYAYAGDQGDDEGVIELGGLLGDEWHSSDTFPTRNQIDERLTTNDNAQAGSIYNRIQRARVTAEFAVQQYAALEPGNPLEAEAYSFAGYAIVLMAENYCSGIPFSKENSNGTLTFGQPESTNQMLHDARVRFDSALKIAIADTTGGNAQGYTEFYFASIGKARTLVDSGDYADAAQAVANVPTTFVFNQGYALTPRRAENGVYEFNVSKRGSRARPTGRRTTRACRTSWPRRRASSASTRSTRSSISSSTPATRRRFRSPREPKPESSRRRRRCRPTTWGAF